MLSGGFFEALLGNLCRPHGKPPEDAICCSCRDEGELLTSAWIDNLESADVDIPKLPIPGMGGQSPRGCNSPVSRGGMPPVLTVPPEFDLVRFDRFGDTSYSTRTPDEQQRLLQTCLRSFARALLRGIRMSVLLDDGRTLLTEASLDSELTHLVLHMPNVQCPVALRCIEKICSPDEVTAGAVLTTNQAYLDERCTTLVLRGGQFLTFVFETSKSREYFEMCLKVLILAKGQEELSAGSGESQSEPQSPSQSQPPPEPSPTVLPTGAVELRSDNPVEKRAADSAGKQSGTGGTCSAA